MHKTLQLVEYLLKNGSVLCIDDCAGHTMAFAALAHFRAPPPPPGAHATPEERAAEEGCRLVRAKAASLLALLDDHQALAACREEAARSAGRYVGIGSDTIGRRYSSPGRAPGTGFGSSDISSGASLSRSTAGTARRSTAPSAFTAPSARGQPPPAAAAREVRPFSLGGSAGSALAARALERALPAQREAAAPLRDACALEDYHAEAAAMRAGNLGRAAYKPPTTQVRAHACVVLLLLCFSP